jgi:predicted phage terminase large subunit-like protein
MITPTLKLKTAKHIAPAMFENKTPKVHIRLLEFLEVVAKFKAISMARGMGKTTVLNKIDMFSSLFYKHEKYTQIFSTNEKKATKFLHEVKNMVLNAIKLGYDIQKGDFWSSTQMEIIVDGEHKCYLEVFGAGQDPRGGSYEFSRPTHQIFDDVESTSGQFGIRTKANREKLADWFWADCVPSLDPINGRLTIIGTILHEDSLLNNLLQDDRFTTLVMPIIEDGKSSWADRFPLTNDEAKQKALEMLKATGKQTDIESIESIKKSYKKKGQLTLFYQEYLCQAQSEEARLFKQDNFKYFSKVQYDTKCKYFKSQNAQEQKTIQVRIPKYIILEDGKKIEIDNMIKYSTMDLASTGKGKNDKSVIITCGYDNKNNMYVLDISAGHWTPFDKNINAMRVYKEFTPLKFGIEKAGMQNDYFYTIDTIQKEQGIKIPVAPLSHGGINKNIRISNLQPLFMANKIYFNESDPNTSLLEAQFLSFNIDIEGTHDDLIDTLAYQHHFIKGRTFEDDDYEEDDDSTW